MNGSGWQFAASQTWMMTAQALEAVLAFAERATLSPEMIAALHAGEAEAVSAKAGKPMDGTRSVSIRDGVAEIPVRGPISRYAGFFSDFSGGTSVQALARDFRAALDNPAVKAILLDVNSPGGSADGIGELANQIHEARGRKPICAYVGNLGASAAYYIASAADEIIVAPAATVGSIGVVCCVNPKRSGPKEPIEIVSTQSPRKRLDPGDEEGRADIQDQVDQVAAVFVDDVARFRGTTAEKVQSDYGKGGVRIGKAAVEAGMADRVGSYESLHRELSTGVRPTKPQTGMNAASLVRSAKMAFSWKSLFMQVAEKIEDDVDVEGLEASADAVTKPVLAEVSKDALFAEEKVAALVAAARAEEKALSLGTIKAAFKTQAEAFLTGAVKAGKVLPAEVQKLALLYSDFALADHQSPISAVVAGTTQAYSRLSHFTEEILARGKNNLGQETIPADGTELPASLAGLKVLPQASAEPADKTKANAETVLALLKSTDEGKTALAALTSAK